MPHKFNHVAQAPYSGPTTTARELGNELSSFLSSLTDTARKLKEEISQTETSVAEIQEEYDATAKSFVKNTLTELNGDKFDEFAELAQNTPELGGQGLAFFRDKLIAVRDAVLKSINATRNETVDAEGFEAALASARTSLDASTQKKTETSQKTSDAAEALETWQRDDAYKFVELNDEALANGKPALSRENAAYYFPSNIFQGAVDFVTKGPVYRKIHGALLDYGQEENGKDLFAEMGNYLQKTKDLETAAADAQTAYEAATAETSSAVTNYNTLFRAKSDIKTDDEILAQVQDKVVSYLSTPEFRKAVADKYGEDFPHAIPLLAAKLGTLEKLQTGAEEKMQGLAENISQVTKQYRKISSYKPFTPLPVNLDDIKQQNEARSATYDGYVRATSQSRNRTVTYSPPSTTVYVDNSPDFFDYLIWQEILTDNEERHHSWFNDNNQPSLTPYSADLLGIDKSSASNAGLPDAIFDTLPNDDADKGFSGGVQFDNLDQPSQLDSIFDSLPATSTRSESAYNAQDDYSARDYSPRESSSGSYEAPSYGGSGS